MINNADQILFRASGIGHIMHSEKSKVEFTDTCKTHLIDIFVSAKYGRRKEIKSKYLEKGNQREADSLTLLSRIDKTFYKKNEKHLKNAYIMGTPDCFIGETIETAEEIIDTKTSWSANTFFCSQKSLEDMYYWQGQSYMNLTGAKKHTVAYCLVNGTASAIVDEKRKLAWHMGVIDTENDQNYIDKCKQIEINHIFDMEAFIKENPGFDFSVDLSEWHWDIPKEERVYKFSFLRDDAKILAIYDRVRACRKWLNDNMFKVNSI